MKKIIVLIVAIVILVTSVSLYKNTKDKNPSKELPKFRLAQNLWVGYGPFRIAQEKGFFAEEGIDVEITVIEDVAQKKAAIVKGEVDGLADTPDLLVLAQPENVPATAVMQIDLSSGADGILATSDIKTISDLKGKKVAVQRNFVSESFLYYMLKKHGLTPKDIEVIDMEASSAGAAFVSGQVDVAVTFEPWMSKANERPGGHILASSKEADKAIVDTLSINSNYLANNPENVKKVMRAWFKAIEFIKNNPLEANEIMAKYYNVPADEFAELLLGLEWPEWEEQKVYFGTNSNPGPIYAITDTFINVFLETGQIQERPNMKNAIDGTLLQELYDLR